MKTLYISDMDGTLLQSGGALSEYTKEKLNEFYEKGIYFSVATARSIVSLPPLVEGVSFNAPVVLMNGVFVYDIMKDKAISYHEIPRNAIKKIRVILEEHKVYPMIFLWGDDGKMSMQYIELDSEHLVEFYHSRKKMLDGRFTRAHNLEDIPENTHPVYFSYFAPKEKLVPVVEKLKNIPEIDLAFYKDSYSEDWLVEIYSAEASKARGAEEIKEYLGAESVTAFGDNLNDIIMLKGADRAVAVGNAVPEVKEIADVIIGTNNEDSVVNFIARDVDKSEEK